MWRTIERGTPTIIHSRTPTNMIRTTMVVPVVRVACAVRSIHSLRKRTNQSMMNTTTQKTHTTIIQTYSPSCTSQLSHHPMRDHAMRWISYFRSNQVGTNTMRKRYAILPLHPSHCIRIHASINNSLVLHRSFWTPTRRKSASQTSPPPTHSSTDPSSPSFTPPGWPPMADDYNSSPTLFDASHLLSGLHEDKKERLRCIEVDDTGNYRDVEFSRAELSSMMNLHPRDLRFLDSSMRNLPSILARRKVIIVNLEMFKALITTDRVLMFDPWYPHVQSTVQPLQAAVLNGGELFEGKPVPFEFIALEHILQTVCSTLEDRFDLYIASLEPLLASTSGASNKSSSSSSSSTVVGSTAVGGVPPPRAGDTNAFNLLVQEGSGSTLMHLLQLKNGLTSFEVTLRETGKALRELLNNDEDMIEMYLTQKAHSTLAATAATGEEHISNREKNQEHSEVEVILETYCRKVDELENEVEQNVKSITLTEEHIQIRLDSVRNSIMKLDLLTSISTLGVTTAALGAGLFGMNLPSHLEGNPYAFWACAGLFGIVASIIIRQGLKLCKRRGIHLFQIDPKEPVLTFPKHHGQESRVAASAAARAERTRPTSTATATAASMFVPDHYAQYPPVEGLNALALQKMANKRHSLRMAKLQGSPPPLPGHPMRGIQTPLTPMHGEPSPSVHVHKSFD